MKNMIRFLGTGLLLLMLSLYSAPQILLAQESVQPLVAILEADAVNTITRTMASPDFTFFLTLTEQSRQATVEDLRLTFGPLERTDGTTGQAASLTWSVEGQKADSLRLSPGQRQSITVQGTLPQVGQYTGRLFLDYGEQTIVYIVSLTRQPAPEIVILEANEGKVDLLVGGPIVTHTLNLLLPPGQPALNDLLINPDPMVRQDGVPDAAAALDCRGCGPQTLQPGQPLSITLQARDLAPGAYRSALRLIYQGQQQVVPLQLTRSALRQNLKLGQIGQVQNTRWLFGLIPTVAQVPFAVRETEAQPGTIYPPQLGTLQLTNEQGKAFNLAPEQIRLWQRDATGQKTDIITGQLVALPPNNTLTFGYDLGGRWWTSGTYGGEIEVSGPNSATITQPFTLTVRHDGLSALIVIGLGVTLAWVLQSWLDRGRQQALFNLEIARRRQFLPRPEGDSVWIAISQHLDILQTDNDLRRLNQETLNQRLQDVHLRQTTYAQARILRSPLEALLQSYPTRPHPLEECKQGFAKQFETSWQKLQATLSDSQAVVGEATGALTELRQLQAEIERSIIVEPARILRGQLQQLSQENPQLTQDVQEVIAIIDQYLLADPVQGNLSSLKTYWHQAQQDYARLWLNHLQTALDNFRIAQVAVPYADDDSIWGAVKTAFRHAQESLGQAESHLKAQEQTNKALDSLQQAQQQHLLALIERLTVLASSTGRPSDIPLADWSSIIEPVTADIQAHLAVANRAIRAGQYEAAQNGYTAAQQNYLKIAAKLLERRVDHLQELTQTQPPRDEKVNWSSLAKETVNQAVKALVQIKEILPIEDDPALTWSSKYDQAYNQFLQAQAQLWLALIERLKEYQNEVAQGQDWWRQSFPATIAELEKRISQAQVNMPNQPQKAEQALNKTADLYKKLLSDIPAPPGVTKASIERDVIPAVLAPMPTTTIGTSSQPPGSLLSWVGLSLERLLGGSSQATTTMTEADWRIKIQRQDRWVMIVILIFTALSGLLALWVPNLTFGSVEDYITAFLWGFGFQKGLTDLIGKYTLAGKADSTV